MIQAVVIDNDTFGTREAFQDNPRIRYQFAGTGSDFAPVSTMSIRPMTGSALFPITRSTHF